MQTEWKVFEAPLIGVIIWFSLTIGFCIAAGIILTILDAAKLVMIVFAMLGSIGIGSDVAIARARVRYNDQKIESRYFKHVKENWDDATGWSRLGENGTVFIGFQSCEVIGSDRWALSEDDVEELIPVLQQKFGRSQNGCGHDHAVVC